MRRHWVVAASIGMASFLLTVGSVCATQYVAARFGYRARLGRPLFAVGGVSIYSPWEWVEWWGRYEEIAPRVFGVAQAFGFAGALAGIGVVLGVLTWSRRSAG